MEHWLNWDKSGKASIMIYVLKFYNTTVAIQKNLYLDHKQLQGSQVKHIPQIIKYAKTRI